MRLLDHRAAPPAPGAGGMTARLFDQHKELLIARAIAPGVARARGYSSTVLPAWLRQEGFSAVVSGRIPGLVIPVHDVHGDVAYHQYRPDKPRLRDGKPVKYETPARTRPVLDVPPQVRGKLDDPGPPLWITEGPLKADAGVSAGLVCIATTGVWGWRGTNRRGGRTALACWEHIALAGRTVYLAPDSDVATNPAVANAVARLGAMLGGRGADVRYVYLPPAADGAKVGLDDYLANGGETASLIANADDEPPARPARDALSTPGAVPAQAHTPPPLATGQDILARLVRVLDVCCGLAGETRTAQLIYLAVLTQMLGDPVSLAVKGLSSSGKSYTLESVLRAVPDEAVIVMTAMSERALVYMRDEFSHRTLVLYEAVALREEREKTESNLTAYIVRSLLSEGHIRYPVAVRGENGLETQWIVKDGPTNLLVTTTATSLHGENETRMLSLPTDDSAGQTRAVLRSIAAGHGPADFAEWHRLFRWLKHAGKHDVTVPYAGWLAESVPTVAVRLRRDFRALLRLIEAHAILHQQNRGTDDAGRIVATEADYLAVRALVADLIADAVGATVSPAMRETVQAVAAADAGQGVRVLAVSVKLGIERSRAQRRLAAARERGYLVNEEEKRGRPARYVIGDPLPDELAILPPRVCSAQCTPPCTAFCAGPAGQTGVCACAGTAPGVGRAPA